MIRRPITTLLAATLVALGLLAAPALAAPAEVPGPPTHEHTLVVRGTGAMIQVGPPACRVPQAERGARNFHIRVHTSGSPDGTVPGAAPTRVAGLEFHFGRFCGS